MSKILFISGSVGLGHVTRDVPIAQQMRALDPNTEISWLAEEPAITYLRSMGEFVLPSSERVEHGNKLLPDPEQYTINVAKWFLKYKKQMSDNAQVLLEIIRQEKPNLVIGDETMDLVSLLYSDRSLKDFKFGLREFFLTSVFALRMLERSRTIERMRIGIEKFKEEKGWWARRDLDS